MDRAKLRKEFLTLRGHVLMLGGPFAAFMITMDLYRAYQGRWLTWGVGVGTVVAYIAVGALSAAVLWYAGTRPLMRKSGR